MERNYMKQDILLEIDYITDNRSAIHTHENIELDYVIEGSLVMEIEDEKFLLMPGDMIIVNANRRHGYEGSLDFLMARFCISYVKITELLGMDHVLFWCYSARGEAKNYQELRHIILKILNQSIHRGGKSSLVLNSLYYQLLSVLTTDFMLLPENLRYEAPVKNDENDRIQEIFSYIRTNYRENITLSDLADQLFLTPTYVSKYIRKNCNMTFLELLNQVRLAHAMEDLMYTNDSIMKIALDNGFASVSAYNKTFKEAYQVTPVEFRKEHRKSKDGGIRSRDTINEKTRGRLKSICPET